MNECVLIGNREETALSVSSSIRKASWLGKDVCNAAGRRLAYRAKSEKISNALLRFPEFFRVINLERTERHGLMVLVRLADGYGVHAPVSKLSSEARKAALNEVLHCRYTPFSFQGTRRVRFNRCVTRKSRIEPLPIRNCQARLHLCAGPCSVAGALIT